MSGTSVIKQVPPKDLRGELRAFIAGANRPSTVSQVEMVRKALTLLRTLPASREAIFEYLGTIFDKCVSNYVTHLENETKNINQSNVNKDTAVIDELHTSLTNFVTSNPAEWSIIISKWCFELLGTLSSKYSNRGRAPVNRLLSDSLQQWMSCRATRSLLEVTSHSFTSITDPNKETICITSMLDTCVQYSPHFDWVVAHIASCFPSKVITRVLSWGLKNHNHESVNRPKLNSVIGILLHLSGCHVVEIRKAMLELFQWSLQDKDTEDKELFLSKAGVVPFLLQLASLSPVLLAALSANTSQFLNPDVFKDFAPFVSQWIKYTGSRQILLDLLVHIILYTEENAQHVILLLLKTTELPDKTIANVGEEVLELLMKELDLSVRVSGAKIPLLDSILKNVNWVMAMLLSEHELRTSTAVTLLTLIGHQQPTIVIKCVSYILLKSNNDDHLAAVVKLSQGFNSNQILIPSVAFSLNTYKQITSDSPQLFWRNLSKLLKWETSGTLVCLPMQEAVWENLIGICEVLTETKDIAVAHWIAEVVKRTVAGSKIQPNVHLIMSVIQATVAYFYLCLMHAEGTSQLKGIHVVNSLLSKLCQGSGGARTMALRELLESALFKAPSVLFGAIPQHGSRLVQPFTSLLNDNHKQGTTTLLAQRHSSVFHSGVIGSGKRKATPECPIPAGKVRQNTHLLVTSLEACTASDSTQGTLDAVISLALLLVELISPDVMYNGLPWPEEEFCKVTVERDLYIRRVVDTMPLLWSLLEHIAYHRPALCYCSVILRALVATLIGQWSSSSQQGRGIGYNKSLILTTTKVLQVMSLGQLLPPPLSVASDVIPHLPPHQVVMVLRDCVWSYMRDHVPSPAMFSRDANGGMWRDPQSSRPSKQYTETLRLVIQRNISSLGALFNTLFVQDLEED